MDNPVLKILLLEDLRTDAMLVERELKKAWKNFYFEVIYDKEKLHAKMRERHWDLIISDFMMPQMTGLDAIRIVREHDKDVPFIMVSGTMGEEIAVEVMKAGANDYLLKKNLHRLNIVIEKLLKEREKNRYLLETEKELKEVSFQSEAVIKDSPLGIVVRDRNLKILLHNKSWKRIWDYSDEDIARQSGEFHSDWREFYDYAKDYHEQLREVFEEGKELVIPEIKLKHKKENRAQWISHHFYSLKDEEGAVDRIVSITEDITAMKAEEKFSNLKISILEKLNRSGNWKDLLEEILEELQSVTGHDCWGLRLNRDNDYPYFVYRGFAEEFVNLENYLFNSECKDSDLDCICGRVILQDHDNAIPSFNSYGSFVTNDFQKILTYPKEIVQRIANRAVCYKFGVKSMALIPLKVENEVLGLLQIQNVNPDAFSLREIAFYEEICRILGIAVRRNRAESQLQNHLQNLDSLINNTSDIIWFIDTDYNLITSNNLFQKLTYPLYKRRLEPGDNLLYNNDLDIDKLQFWKTQYDRVLKGEKYWISLTQNESNDEQEYWFYNFSPVFDDKGNVIGATVFGHNNTDKIKTESRLALSESKFETAFHASPVIMGLSEVATGKYIEVNQTFYEKLGYKPEEVIGNSSVSLAGFDEKCRGEMVKQLTEHGVVKDFETQVTAQDGKVLDLVVTAKVLDFGGEKVIFVSAIDITERKIAEEKFHQAHLELEEMHVNLKRKVDRTVKELRSRDLLVIQQARQTGQVDMLSQIAHHWRQPLNAIGILIQSLSDAYEFEELTAELFDKKIDDSMHILREMSQSIDNFRLIYGGDFKEEEFEVSRYLKDIANLLKARFDANKIDFQVSLEASGLIAGVPSDFAQSIINMLDNAYEILLSREVKEPRVIFASKRLRNEILITIADNGGGIDPKIKRNIFTLYVSGKESLNNTGIGLYMSKTNIEKMNGSIEAENDELGAVFTIRVPLFEYPLQKPE